jgi:hypothetical protein
MMVSMAARYDPLVDASVEASDVDAVPAFLLDSI